MTVPALGPGGKIGDPSAVGEHDEQDARDLAAVAEDVVRPFQREALRQAGLPEDRRQREAALADLHPRLLAAELEVLRIAAEDGAALEIFHAFDDPWYNPIGPDEPPAAVVTRATEYCTTASLKSCR